MENLEAHLQAKGMALQQAGLIPLQTSPDMVIDSIETALHTEGLFKGH